MTNLLSLLFWSTVLSVLSSVAAQFNFFEQMFGHPQAGHQQQRPASGANAGQWMAHADSVSCSQYLCPDTLVCVSNPSDCPCPDVQDVKCLIPDSDDTGGATVVCARGTLDCATVEQLSRKLS